MFNKFDRTLIKLLEHQKWFRCAFLHVEDTEKYSNEYYRVIKNLNIYLKVDSLEAANTLNAMHSGR